MRWRSSFRTRVVVLVALLTTATIAVTVWVTLTATSQSLIGSAQARAQDLDLVAGQLRDYAVDHGTWVGVPGLVADLHDRTGQRIRLVTEQGEVVVDTDTQAGVTARTPSSVAPVAVIPRPELDLADVGADDAGSVTLDALAGYRGDAPVAACLTGHGQRVDVEAGPGGVPGFSWTDEALTASGCGPATVEISTDDQDAVEACGVDLSWRDGFSEEFGLPSDLVPPTAEDGSGDAAVGLDPTVSTCLGRVFQARTADVVAPTLLLYTGVRGTQVLRRDDTRILFAAIPVLVLAILLGVLLARRALRPVDAVIRATSTFAAGRRSARVTVRGRDEMAQLAGSFNAMADSVQRSEEQQRILIADVAHELRTPLANIRGYVEALRDGVMPPTSGVFELLHEEALLQQRVIDDLQDLALADRHTLLGQTSPVDVADLVGTVASAHAARGEAKGVTVTVDAVAPVSVLGDADRLRQALGNLVTNALQATGPGGSVLVRARRTDGDVVVEVSDTGHGIAPDELDRVFDRFWRSEPSRSRRTGGSGLGLAIAREIVRAHGGTLGVTSEPGVGTTFTLRIPAT